MRISKKFIALALIASLGYGTATQQSRAGSADAIFGIIGAVVAVAVVANIVAQLDAESKARHDAAIAAANKKNSGAVNWQTNNASGKIRIVKNEKMPDGRVCKEIEETITFQGKPSKEVRTQCA